MAGDWIKVEHNLHEKPEVLEVSALLDCSDAEAVGFLIRFWSWVDRNLSLTCPKVFGTSVLVDRLVGRDGFAAALERVGWLAIDADGLTVPGYEVHLSQTAKSRAVETKRKQVQRARLSATGPTTVPPTTGQKAGPEKRREEKSLKGSKKNPKGSSVYEKDFSAFLDLILDEWAELFPGKPQPRKSAQGTRTKLRSRFKCKEFRAQWKPALLAASESPHLTEASWFDFGYFINNDENWEKCLHRKWAWKDEQATTAAGSGLPADLAASLGGR